MKFLLKKYEKKFQGTKNRFGRPRTKLPDKATSFLAMESVVSFSRIKKERKPCLDPPRVVPGFEG
jgi:hypothetical protein